MPATFPLTRPRRWALGLGLPIVLIAIAYVALNFVALAARDSHRITAISEPVGANVTLSIGDGDITLAPGADRRARVSGVVHYSLARPHLHWSTTADGTTLAVPGCFWVDCDSATLTASIPAGRSATASSGSGDVHARDLSGALKLSTGSGDMLLSRLSGALVLSDDSGDITGTALAAARVHGNDDSGNVDLSFTRPPSQLSISGDSGDITVRLPPGFAYRVSAKANSGTTDVAVPTSPSSRYVIDLNTDSGNITVLTARR